MKVLELTDEQLFAPRRGRAFSLRLPQAQPQRRWMEQLPWDLMAHVSEEQLTDFRTAFGCVGDGDTDRERFDAVLGDFTQEKLRLRVLRLCPYYRVAPGRTHHEDRARLDRWLPPHWQVDEELGTLSWTRPTRFASPRSNRQLMPQAVPLMREHDILQNHLDCSRAVWLSTGSIWVIVQSSRHNT